MSLSSDKDLVEIREYGRIFAAKIGFNENDRTVVATALSEICRNVIEYAEEGEVTIKAGDDNNCIVIIVRDWGPGIDDVNKALEEGFSSGKGLGIGLPGAKRIMDEFEIETADSNGTKITMCKWLDQKNVL